MSGHVMVEIITPFGVRRIPASQVNWDGIRAMRQFYDSPEGQSLLASYEDEERQFAQEQQDRGIASPTRVPVGATVAVRLIAEDGAILSTEIPSLGGEVLEEESDDAVN